MLPRIARIFSTLLLVTLGACTTQGPMQLDRDENVEVQRTTFSFDQPDMNYELFNEYHIQPGDILDVLFQIRTWLKKPTFKIAVDHTIAVKFVSAPDLNEEQRIRPDGYISLPYIGQYYVIGKTVGEVETELKDLYAKELENPELYVVIPEFQEAIKELKKDLHTAPRGLSRLVTVRPDGRVTFPMVGEVKVAGDSIAKIDKMLNEQYEKILPGLHVDLFLQSHSGALVYVLGEVAKPGAYPIHRPISILQAMTLAEGFNPAARLDSVVVVRRNNDKMVATRTDMKSLLGFGKDQKLFFLKPDDIVVVPKLRIAQAADLAQYIQQAMMFRGWGINGSYELHDESPTDSDKNQLPVN